MDTCWVCGGSPSHYRDFQTGQSLCPAHARVAVVAPGGGRKDTPIVRAAVESDRDAVVALANLFWGELEVDAFGRTFDIERLPAYVAVADGRVVGAASYSLEDRDIHLVAMQVLPEYQGRGAGRALVEAVLGEGHRVGAQQAILVTTNDNLPALGMYQRMGFVITEVIPGAVVGYHGGVEEVGFGGIPVRDEIRMTFDLCGKSTTEEMVSQDG